MVAVVSSHGPMMESTPRRSLIPGNASFMDSSMNDDEEERRASRISFAPNSSSNTASSPANTSVEDAALEQQLEIYQEKNINKHNAWSVKLIETFSKMIDRHHKSLENFQIVGSTIEATGKIYELRVDSVHRDVLRMASMSTFSRNQKMDESMADEENVEEEGNVPKKKVVKKKRREVCTVTKNPDTINAKLETNPPIDPLFAQINSFVGENYSSNRLLVNLLDTVKGEFIIDGNLPGWDSSEPEVFCENPLDGEMLKELQTCCMPNGWKDHLLQDKKIRPNYYHYRISDTPLPDNPESDDEGGNDFDNNEFIPTNQDELNPAALAVAFDVNAEVEQVNMDDDYFVDVNNINFDELNDDEQRMVGACRGLRRKPIVLEDMRPTDLEFKSDYAYRPLDNIRKFWAGPSHWKYITPRNRVSGAVDGQQLAKKKKPKTKPIQFSTLQYDPDVFFPLTDKRAEKIRRVNTSKWDPKKLKLPTNYNLDPDMFFKFSLAPGIPVRMPITHSQQTVADEDGSNSMEQNDDSCHFSSQEPHFGDDAEPSTSMDGPLPNLSLGQGNQSLAGAIDDVFEGAPEKVADIKINFAKSAKMINMKELKSTFGNLINKECEATKNIELPAKNVKTNAPLDCGVAKFNTMFKELPRHLSATQTENTSRSVAFYAILHIANERGLTLENTEDHKDIIIHRLQGFNK